MGGWACPRHTGPSRHSPQRWCKKPQETGPSAPNGADRKAVVPNERNARQRNSIKTSWGKKASIVTRQVVSRGIWQNLCQSDGGMEDREIYTNRITPPVCRVHGPKHVAFLFQRKTGRFGWSTKKSITKQNSRKNVQMCVIGRQWDQNRTRSLKASSPGKNVETLPPTMPYICQEKDKSIYYHDFLFNNEPKSLDGAER